MGKTLKIDKLPKLPRRSIIYMLVCGGGVLLFCLIGIFPNLRAISDLDDEIAVLNHKISEQKILFPVFKKMLSRIEQPENRKGPVNSREKLKRDHIAGFSTVLAELAERNGLNIAGNTVDIRGFKEKGGFLEMNFSFSGSLDDFRLFFIRMIALPYDIRVGRLEIQPLSEKKKFQLNLFLALE
ncbi:MAG: hypothetical protein ABIK15_13485 [Pseudomonadota bacterium]